jgi:hypothetical protein
VWSKVSHVSIVIGLALGMTACTGLNTQAPDSSVRPTVIAFTATDDLWMGKDEHRFAGDIEIHNSREHSDLWMPAESVQTPAPERKRETPRLRSFVERSTADRL